MADKRKREKDWAEAKCKCRLNAETVRMARELGLNPRKIIKNIPNKSQQWKAPVHVWIRDMYERRMGRVARKKAGNQVPPSATRDKLDRPVPGCGSHKFLKRHEGFTLKEDALSSDRTALLYDADHSDESDCRFDELPF